MQMLNCDLTIHASQSYWTRIRDIKRCSFHLSVLIQTTIEKTIPSGINNMSAWFVFVELNEVFGRYMKF